VTSEGSSMSRFTQKFIEVLAAGFATAVSGFLIAHFTGFFVATSPTSAVNQPLAIQEGIQAGTQGAVQARPAEPPPVTPAPAASVPNAAAAAALPQSNPTDQPVSSNVPAAKPRAAAETKARDTAIGAAEQSFEARVRAALAKVDATHPTSRDATRGLAIAPIDATSRAPTAALRPIDMRADSIANAPRPTDSASPATPIEPSPIAAGPPQALTTRKPATQPLMIQLAPQATVEIKSQPVAGVDANQPVQAAAEPLSTDQDGPLSAITKRLRSDNPLPENQAPRPPMPVGQ
jgi:hypothetical protein